MKQPTKNITPRIHDSKKSKTPKKYGVRNKKNHPQFGTSKLEQDFARDFLDKLGLEYQWQFEAKDIGRFYDFLVEQSVLLEIDGDYFHSNPLLYEDKDLNTMQKKNKRIDEYKNEWALSHGFPIIRIWEHDIRKNPEKVLKMLKERFYIDDEKTKVYKTTQKVTPKRRQIKK